MTLTRYHRFILSEILADGRTRVASDVTDLGLAQELQELIDAGLVKRIGSQCGGTTLRMIRRA